MGRDRKAEIRDALERSALRSTGQRFAMLDYLTRTPGHLTADEIFAGIIGSGRSASRATVYNNLHALVQSGVLQEVVSGPGAVRYDINHQWHHHFICDRCGALEDIEGFDIPGLAWRPQLGSRAVRNYQILFRGACERCSKRSTKKATRRKEWEK